MNNLQGRRILITGASSGIGAACALRFAAAGALPILWARRDDRLQDVAADVERQHGVRSLTRVIDVRDRDAVNDAVATLRDDGAIPHVLLNNAGLASGFDYFQSSDPDDWDRMIDTNIKGLLNVTRAVMPLMIEQQAGHIINLGSTAAHMTYPRGNVYAATKAAVFRLSQGLNLDAAGTPLRVSCIDPGFVETEFSVVRFHGDEDRARQVYRGFQPLTADDVAECIFFIANAPPHVNVADMLLMPTAQRNIYIVDRDT